MLSQVFSLVGAFFILLAYFLLQSNKVTNSSFLYLNSNLLGASFLLASAILLEQVGLIVLQLVWIAVTLRGVLGKRKSK